MTSDQTPPLSPAFLRAPIAHRGYYDLAAGRQENSRAAFVAAIEAGYCIETDVQLSADGRAMIFHDHDLGRLTNVTGPIRQRRAADLQQIILQGSHEGIPTLTEILALVAGRAPLLIEIKDQDGSLGPNVGALEAALARDLAGYAGPVAVMSFNPNAVAAFKSAAPDHPCGLTTGAFPPEVWSLLPASTRDRLRQIPDFDRVGASFISHQATDLTSPRVSELKRRGTPILCWTIHNADEERSARRIADNITFDQYTPEIPPGNTNVADPIKGK